MHIDPLNLLPSSPVDWTSPIVSRALGFNAESDTHCMHPCVYPRVKDTCIMEHRPDVDVAMEDAPVGSGIGKSEDAIEIECALRNASIGGCKDALLAFRSIDDNENEGGGEDPVDAHMSNDLSFGGVGYVKASHEPDSNPAKYSKQGNEEQHVEKEGDEAVDLLAHNVDPYEDAMRDDADGGFHAFFPSKP